MSQNIIRKIAVIFVTDVVGFSKMMERNEDNTLGVFGFASKYWKTFSPNIVDAFSIRQATQFWLSSKVLFLRSYAHLIFRSLSRNETFHSRMTKG